MKVNFLEQLVAEWCEYNGYLVWTNVRVGRLELDVVAFHPGTKKLVHVEASMDKDWNYLTEKCTKTFPAGREYVSDKFRNLLPNGAVPDQIALLEGVSRKKRSWLAVRLFSLQTISSQSLRKSATYQ